MDDVHGEKFADIIVSQHTVKRNWNAGRAGYLQFHIDTSNNNWPLYNLFFNDKATAVCTYCLPPLIACATQETPRDPKPHSHTAYRTLDDGLGRNDDQPFLHISNRGGDTNPLTHTSTFERARILAANMIKEEHIESKTVVLAGVGEQIHQNIT